MILYGKIHLELSTRKGTKNVRETSDMGAWQQHVFINEKIEKTKIFEHRMKRIFSYHSWLSLIKEKTSDETDETDFFVSFVAFVDKRKNIG